MKTKQMFAVLIMLVATSSMTWAGSTLHIGFGAGTACATGCAGDPNTGFSDTFDIFQNSGGIGDVAIDPILLILGVPNETGSIFTTGSIINVTTINPYPGGTVDTTNDWTFDGFHGEFTSAFSGITGCNSADVYCFLGLTGANASNNWTNWHDTELALTGIDASGFGIYIFELFAATGDIAFGPKGLIDITFQDDSTVPIGTYIIGYGQNASGNIYSTPFTESGIQTPEPASLLLLGTGLLGIGRMCRKKQKKA